MDQLFQKFILLFVVLFTTVTGSSLAAVRGSLRKKTITLGLTQAPLPNIYSLSFAYSWKPYFSTGVGYGGGVTYAGTGSRVHAVGAFLGWHPFSHWKFFPVVRFGGQTNFGGPSEPYDLAVESVTGTYEMKGLEPGISLWTDFGIEWRFWRGARVGTGYGIPFRKGSGNAPYFRVSYSF